MVASFFGTDAAAVGKRMQAFRKVIRDVKVGPEYQVRRGADFLHARVVDESPADELVDGAARDLLVCLFDNLTPQQVVNALLALVCDRNGSPDEHYSSLFGVGWQERCGAYNCYDEFGMKNLPETVRLREEFRREQEARSVRRERAKLAVETVVQNAWHQGVTRSGLVPIGPPSAGGSPWLVRDVLRQGQPAVMGGPAKSLKTTLACELAVCLTKVEPFLGFTVPRAVRVSMFSGESGADTLWETITERTGGKMPDNLKVYASTPKPEILAKQREADGADVVIFDPLFTHLGETQTSNLGAMGKLLRDLTDAVAPATLVVVHHCTKGIKPGRQLVLSDLTGVGTEEWARQWLLVNRKVRFDASNRGHHSLIVSGGGSYGHCWIKDVIVSETFQPKQYAMKVADHVPKKEPQDQTRRGQSKPTPADRLLAALREHDGMLNEARDSISNPTMSGSTFKSAREQLEQNGTIKRISDDPIRYQVMAA